MVDGEQSLYDAHRWTEATEQAVRREIADVDDAVHAESYRTNDIANPGR